MIVAHSFSFGDAAFQVAPEFPNANWCGVAASRRWPRTWADYDQPFRRPILSASLPAIASKTGKLGAIYGADIPVCHVMRPCWPARRR